MLQVTQLNCQEIFASVFYDGISEPSEDQTFPHSRCETRRKAQRTKKVKALGYSSELDREMCLSF
jgi:hypothetical protein